MGRPICPRFGSRESVAAIRDRLPHRGRVRKNLDRIGLFTVRAQLNRKVETVIIAIDHGNDLVTGHEPSIGLLEYLGGVDRGIDPEYGVDEAMPPWSTTVPPPRWVNARKYATCASSASRATVESGTATVSLTPRPGAETSRARRTMRRKMFISMYAEHASASDNSAQIRRYTGDRCDVSPGKCASRSPVYQALCVPFGPFAYVAVRCIPVACPPAPL
jgi:hypothetical protein